MGVVVVFAATLSVSSKLCLLFMLKRPQSRRTDHLSNIVVDREFSTDRYLFTVSNSGLLFYSKRVSTTPSHPRPLPLPTTS